MDILNSQILNINGRLYVNYFQEGSHAISPRNIEDQFEYEDENDSEETKYNYEKSDKGLFTHSLKVPSALFKYVIGSRGDTKKRIEYETGVKVHIPPRGQKGDIVITAKHPSSVDAAKTRIELLLSEKRWREPFTHFVSIPLNTSELNEGYNRFKNEVLSHCGKDRGIEEKLFSTENKVHLTIGTLVLLDEKEYQKASEVLDHIMENEVISEISTNMVIDVHGIEYMNDDPDMVDVLYAKVKCRDGSDSLQILADRIVEEFVASGLMKKEHDHVKLHATVMNSLRLVERRPQQHGKQLTKRTTFSAKNLLKDFNEFHFGEIHVNEIHISIRHSVGKDGYYDHIHIAKLNESSNN